MVVLSAGFLFAGYGKAGASIAATVDAKRGSWKSISPEDVRIADAKKILADFQAGAPRKYPVLQVAYFCPVDRLPAPDYQGRLERVLEDISEFYTT